MAKDIRIGPNTINYNNIALVNGCFDLFHAGHYALLKYASEFGLGVVVGIDSDLKIKNDKGPNRPFFSQEERKEQLLSLPFVREVFIFDSNIELDKQIQRHRPAFLIKGNNWQHHIVGAAHAKHIILFKEKLPISTSEIEKKVMSKINFK